MEIAAILHNVRKARPELFLKRLEEALKSCADITIGPDYALNQDLNRPNTSAEKEEIYSRIKRLSLTSGGLVIPGTMSYPVELDMVHVAPVFFNGKLVYEFLKERDNGESELAKRAGLTFRRGDNSHNMFPLDTRNIAVEICGDHGNQNVRRCDIELILAFDRNAGFYINSGNGSWARRAVVCDGYKPFASAFDYDPARTSKLISISGDLVKLKHGKMKVFEI